MRRSLPSGTTHSYNCGVHRTREPRIRTTAALPAPRNHAFVQLSTPTRSRLAWRAAPLRAEVRMPSRMAGAEGFEPSVTDPKSVALPLGHAPCGAAELVPHST